MTLYTPENWYWVVSGADGKVYSSASEAYVLESNTKYRDWLKNNTPTQIASEQELADVLSRYGLEGPVSHIPDYVPMWAVRTVLASEGLFDRVNQMIMSGDDAAVKNVWEYGNFASRSSTVIAAMAAGLNLTPAQVDEMFVKAGKLEP